MEAYIALSGQLELANLAIAPCEKVSAAECLSGHQFDCSMDLLSELWVWESKHSHIFYSRMLMQDFLNLPQDISCVLHIDCVWLHIDTVYMHCVRDSCI